MKNAIFPAIIFFLLSPKLSFATDQALLTCHSTKSCAETTIGLAQLGLFFAGLLGPHYFVNNYIINEKLSTVQVGVGPETIKFSTQFASLINKSEPHNLITKASLQKIEYSEDITYYQSQFGVGYGFTFNYDDYIKYETTILADAIQFSYISKTYFEPDLLLRAIYYYNDKLKPFISLNLIGSNKIKTIIEIGSRFKTYNFSIAHEHIKSNDKKLLYLNFDLRF